MMAQNNFKVVTREQEQTNNNLRDLKFYKMSLYNESLAYYIDDNNLLVQANIPAAKHSLIMSISDFDNNKFPLLPENDTPYYRYRELMNKEGFTKVNMLKIFDELNFNYRKDTFYADAEKFVKTLSLDDKMTFLIPALYFIGEDLHRLCPNAEWQFDTLYYFQPFSEVGLYYDKRQFSFYNLNLLLEDKLLNNKSITFKSIFKRVEKQLMKDKELWWDFGNVKGD
ncbi:hypothetical protein [Chryseobacterium sp.]|jgi:hypothetical protein|uniref:hypothetical protein n=1 Tax=Chryseobacterium sp. TaxID=1871047 RepID=UPI00285297F6|nr:hypothetical protein [Chryseobacterium sp.]